MRNGINENLKKGEQLTTLEMSQVRRENFTVYMSNLELRE